MKYIVGIDEAGRGPLAGPVAVGAVCVTATSQNSKVKSKNELKKLFKGARDSKKMTPKKREEIFLKMKQAQGENLVRYIVLNQSAKNIDAKGISWCIQDCIKKCLKKLKVRPKQTLVLLDGGIKAPKEFIHQKTIIRGDDKELVISLASIAAKVTRDAHMRRLSKKYPRYGLDIHKGYGTAAHRRAIRTHGPSAVHRKSFLRNIK